LLHGKPNKYLLKWPPSGARFDAPFSLIPDPGYDRDILTHFEDMVRESLSELTELGLLKMRDEYHKYIYEVSGDKESVAHCNGLQKPECLVGYIRSNIEMSHIEQVYKIPPRPSNTTTPLDPYLEQMWYDFGIWMIDNNHMKTYDELLDMIPAYLTSKSASSGTITETILLMGKRVDIKMRNKIAHFFHDPERFLDPANLMKELTQENPGKTGNRDTPGKPSRAIFMIALTMYICEIVLATALYAYQNTKSEFSISHTTGRRMTDDYDFMRFCGSGEFLMLLKDFSQFDSSEGTQIREPSYKGLETAFAERGLLNARWGPYMSYIRLIKYVWNKYNGAIFQFGKVNLSLSQVYSGEFITLAFNNMTNAAYGQYFSDQLKDKHPEVHAKLKNEKEELQGDDATDSFRLVDKKLDVKEISSLLKTAETSAASVGLEINAKKGGISYTRHEYCKRWEHAGMCGAQSQGPQLGGAENGSVLYSGISYISSLKGYMITHHSRGAKHIFLFRYIHAVWMFRSIILTSDASKRGDSRTSRRVSKRKGERVEHDITKDTYYPFDCLYLPLSMGGIGLSRYGLVSVNCDALIIHDALHDQPFRERLNNARWTIAGNIPRLRHNAAKKLIKKGVFDKGINYLKQHQIYERIENQESGERYLGSKIVTKYLNGLKYTEAPKSTIQRSIQDNPSLNDLDYYQRDFIAASIKERGRITEKDFLAQHSWLADLDFTPIALLDKVLPFNPFVGQDELANSIYEHIGLSSDADPVLIDPSIFLNELRKDPYFPRAVQPETIVDILSSPEIAGDTEKMAAVLAVMGVRNDIASSLLSNLEDRINSFMFFSVAHMFSMNDDLLKELDFSQSNLERVVEIPEIVHDSYIQRLLYGLGMLYAIVIHKGKYRIKVTGKTDTIMRLRDILTNKTYISRTLISKTYFPETD